MELKGQRTLAADRATAWAALNDTDVLRLCVPGCESIAATGPNQYEILMTAAIGPVKAKFKGKMEMTDIDAPNGYTLKFDGQGGPAGFARGDAKVNLTVVSANETMLNYMANAQVGGKLAQIGSRLVDAAAGATADKFFAAFSAQLAVRVPAAGASRVSAPLDAPPATRLSVFSLLVAMIRRLLGRTP